MTAHVLHMATMGLLVAVIAPGLLVVLGRAVPKLNRWTVPAAVALPGFAALHAAVAIYTDRAMLPPLPDTAMDLVLLCGAMLFWTPVLGTRHRLPDACRMLYLYTAIPLLDLAGVWLIATGDMAGGLAMIVGMLPMGAATVAITCNWINREERRAVLDETMRALGVPAGEGGQR